MEILSLLRPEHRQRRKASKCESPEEHPEEARPSWSDSSVAVSPQGPMAPVPSLTPLTDNIPLSMSRAGTSFQLTDYNNSEGM